MPVRPIRYRAEAREAPAAEQLIAGAMAALEAVGVRYCLLHAPDAPALAGTADVDCLIDETVSAAELFAALQSYCAGVEARIVMWDGFYGALSYRARTGDAAFVHLDFVKASAVEGWVFYRSADIWRRRRREGPFWVLAPGVAFASDLARAAAKGQLDHRRVRRLDAAFRDDRDGCKAELARFWSPSSRTRIVEAVRSCDWTDLQDALPAYREELKRAVAPGLAAVARARLANFTGRMRRLRRPDGVFVALLGPDGAGKSSVIEALEHRLASLFPKTVCHGFTPGWMHRLRHGEYRENRSPHKLAPRSKAQSILRALGYWYPSCVIGYGFRRAETARRMLVLNDRYLIDAAVDPTRYRYSGPAWLVRLLAAATPHPDLLVVLDAPAETIQARKQEVPLEETARQRRAYLAVARSWRGAVAVDAGRALPQVVEQIVDAVLEHMAARVLRRFGAAEPSPSARARSSPAPVSREV
jgi:thymidylate kinase